MLFLFFPPEAITCMMHGSFKNIIHFPQRLSLKGEDPFYTIEMASIILRAEAVLSEILNICKNPFYIVGCVHMSFQHVTVLKNLTYS